MEATQNWSKRLSVINPRYTILSIMCYWKRRIYLPAGAKSKTWFWSGKPHFLNDNWGDDEDNIFAIKSHSHDEKLLKLFLTRFQCMISTNF